MTVGNPIPLCWWCSHLDVARWEQQVGLFVCKAFPSGVPDEILGDSLGPSFDHHQPHSDDNGIQFEKIESYEEAKRRFPLQRYPTMQYVDAALARVENILSHLPPNKRE